MNADLELLVPEFKAKVQILLNACASRGIEMKPYFTIRDPFSQAKLWRQSRTTFEIQRTINDLRSRNANFLADCIKQVGPQSGTHVTNAIPGLSWHQWGEAVDCCWIVNKKAIWDLSTLQNGVNGYQIYATEARKIELDAGYFWPNFQDSPHVQFRKYSNPLKLFSITEIDKRMESQYGHVLNSIID